MARDLLRHSGEYLARATIESRHGPVPDNIWAALWDCLQRVTAASETTLTQAIIRRCVERPRLADFGGYHGRAPLQGGAATRDIERAIHAMQGRVSEGSIVDFWLALRDSPEQARERLSRSIERAIYASSDQEADHHDMA